MIEGGHRETRSDPSPLSASPAIREKTLKRFASLTRQDLPIKHMRNSLKTIERGTADPSGKAASASTASGTFFTLKDRVLR